MKKYMVTEELKTPWHKYVLRFFRIIPKRIDHIIESPDLYENGFQKGDVIELVPQFKLVKIVKL